MCLKNEIKTFVDCNGVKIKAGNILRRDFYARWRERPGHKRVAINGMSGNESIVSDEGGLLDAERHWVTYKVGFNGACLIAERLDYSDFQVLSQAEKFNKNGEQIFEGTGFYYFNSVFKSELYRIQKA